MRDQGTQRVMAAPTITRSPQRVLQRDCGCGQHMGGGACEACGKQRDLTLERAVLNREPVSMGPRLGHDFSQIPIYPPAVGALQTKLAINTPGDEYEQQADHLAEQVTRMHVPPVQMHPPGQTEAPPIVHDVVRSPGQPLDAAICGFMEPRFGHDFSKVRVHTDSQAAASAHAVHALAYTVGRDIAFGTGQYRPDSALGRRLIAHELAHVVQQSPAAGRTFEPGSSLRLQRQAVPVDVELEPTSPEETEALRQRGVRLPQVSAGTFATIGGDPNLLPILPGYSQEGDTCGAASLVTALIIWDRQHRDPAAPNARVVTACNLILTHLAQRRQATIDGWNRRGRNGEQIYGAVRSMITRIRDAARAPGAVLSENDYQSIGIALYALWVDGRSGLSAAEIGNLQSMLGLATQTSTSVQSFAEIFASSVLRGLQPDQIAQVGWYVRTGASGRQASYGHHAFLIGRLQTGQWFLSDQGTRPARQFTAASLDELRDTVNIAAQTGSYWLFTGSIADFQMLVVGGWTGVRLLGSSRGTE